MEKGSNKKLWHEKYFNSHYLRYVNDLKLINEYFKGGEILEIGGFPFHLTTVLKKLNIPTTSVDIQPDRAKNIISDYKLKVIAVDIENNKLPFGNDSFDLILFNEVFEHLRIDPIHALLEINRVLARNGILILTTPNFYSLIRIKSYLLGKGVGVPYQEFMKIKKIGHMGHIRTYSAVQIKEFLTHTNFKIETYSYKSYRPQKITNLPLRTIEALIPSIRTYLTFITTKI